MVIVKIIGGLGNQMFQYAIGRALSLKLNTTFKVDLSFFANQNNTKVQKRVFLLKNLQTVISEASENELNYLTQRIPIKTVDKLLNKIIGRKKTFIYEKSMNFSEDILNSPGNIYLEGYFQSYKYFEAIRPILLNEFTPKLIDHKKSNKIQILNEGQKVSIHVRRGDYVGSSFHPICDLDYYKKSIDFINSNFDDCTFFIFSDDVAWVRNYLVPELSLKSFEIIEQNDSNPEQDLYLMSLCTHNIIANSSFSWWGAWLNQAPNKKVLAPYNWFNDSKWSNKDLIPNEWITL